MGRRKGSKNKKTLLKLARMKAPVKRKQSAYAAATAVSYTDDLSFRVSTLEAQMQSLLAVARKVIDPSEKTLQTISDSLCSLFAKVDSIEKVLSPLMFVEHIDKVSSNEKESESSSEEGRQESIQEN